MSLVKEYQQRIIKEVLNSPVQRHPADVAEFALRLSKQWSDHVREQITGRA